MTLKTCNKKDILFTNRKPYYYNWYFVDEISGKERCGAVAWAEAVKYIRDAVRQEELRDGQQEDERGLEEIHACLQAE